MNPENLVRTAALAGEITLANGAEISRVEDTMSRILKINDFKLVDAFVVPSGIFVSVDVSEHGVVTVVRRVRDRTLNLSKVSEVNNLSRGLVEGTIPPDDAIDILHKINGQPPYPLSVKAPAIAIACFCFTYMFGGSPASSLCAFFVSMLAFLFNSFLGKSKVTGVLRTMITSALIALLASISVSVFPDIIQLDKVIIGGIMQLVPGLGLTNAIRDSFEGDYMSAASRLLDAILIAVSIATGVGVILRLWIFFFGGL